MSRVKRGVTAKARHKKVLALANLGGPPTDMRPLICGAEAKVYVAQRKAEFPLGLRGSRAI